MNKKKQIILNNKVIAEFNTSCIIRLLDGGIDGQSAANYNEIISDSNNPNNIIIEKEPYSIVYYDNNNMAWVIYYFYPGIHKFFSPSRYSILYQSDKDKTYRMLEYIVTS